MAKDTASVMTALQEAVKGLTFPSEADYPIEPFVLEGSADQPVAAAPVLRALGHDPGAPVRTLSLHRFFQPVTQQQPWHNDAERETVRRFQQLVKTLEESLAGIKVFKVGQMESDAFVVGKTASGELAGVKTRVVET